jgi:hypothetical protein
VDMPNTVSTFIWAVTSKLMAMPGHLVAIMVLIYPDISDMVSYHNGKLLC